MLENFPSTVLLDLKEKKGYSTTEKNKQKGVCE